MRIRFDSLHAFLLVAVVLACTLAALGWMRETPRPSSATVETASGEQGNGPRNSPRENPPVAEGKAPGESAKNETPVIPKQRETGPIAASGDGVITGRVWTAQHEAAAGLEVVAFDPNITSRRPGYDGGDYERYRLQVDEYASAVARQSRRAKTDSNGKFRIDGLDKSRAYTLTAGSRYQGGAILEFIAPGSDVELVLKTVPSLRGKVLLPSNDPAGEFFVCVQHGGERPSVGAYRFNNLDGAFEVFLAEGHYRVWAEAAAMQSNAPIDIELGPSGAETVLKLAPACKVTLVVTDLANEPLAGMKVNLSAAEGNSSELAQAVGRHWSNMTNDSQGRVVVSALSPGRYVAEVSGRYNDGLHKQEFEVVQGEQEIRLQVDAGWKLTVKMLEADDKPLEPSFTNLVSSTKDQGRAMEVPTNISGTICYRRVKAGKYQFSARLLDGSSLIREISVAADNTVETVVARPRGRLSGKVQSLHAGGSVENCMVDIKTNDSVYASEARLGADGRYRLRRVETGSYDVVVRDSENREVHKETVVVVEGENERDFSVDTRATLRVKVAGTSNSNDFDSLDVDLHVVGETEHEVKAFSVNEQGMATRSFLKPGDYWFMVRGKLRSGLVRLSLANGLNEIEVAVGRANCVAVVKDGGPEGVRLGDVIVDLNGQRISNNTDLNNARKSLKDGEACDITVERDGRRLTLRLSAAEMKFETLAAFKP